jgi:hypothetical protein
MNKNYECNICKKYYKSYMGYWKHNKKYHHEKNIDNKIKFSCKYCNKELANRHSRWRHEQKCKLVNPITLEEQIKNLSNEIKEIKENKVNTNNSHDTTNNIQYIINSPSNISIKHISYERQKYILDKGLHGLLYLIKHVNFNKKVPENHSFCVTSINDTYASHINEKTNKVIKIDKIDLFDKVLITHLDILGKLTNNPHFSHEEKNEYKNKINNLITSICNNDTLMKKYMKDINLISYNNKEIIKNTWENLKSIEEIPPLNISDSDSDSDSEHCEYHEIKIKGRSYILEGSDVYIKTDNCEKGNHYGIYFSNTGKVKKNLI